jgi:hypothetical protein
LEFLENRSAGIVMDVDKNKKVRSVEFVSGAIGVEKSECK